jgi:hypothetical protein
MVASIRNGNHFNVRAEAAGFSGYDRANPVHGRFLFGGRLAFDQSFE